MESHRGAHIRWAVYSRTRFLLARGVALEVLGGVECNQSCRDQVAAWTSCQLHK
jgi:nitrate reductase alpha subunit